MSEDSINCPVCGLEEADYFQKDDDKFEINCFRCGNFIISQDDLLSFEKEEGFFINLKLSSWIRNFNEQNDEVPEIDLLDVEFLELLSDKISNYSHKERQLFFLQNIRRKTKYPGFVVKISTPLDMALAWATTEEEFIYYINSLIEKGLLRKTEGDNLILTINDLASLVLAPDGWDYLEQHERHIEDRTQAFVAMSFSDDLEYIWEGPIYNAITKAGYKPYRVDAEPHSDRIDAKIISEIKNSRFVEADITEQKRGVYFEAGYALGMGLPVLWCVRKDDMDKVHFDTRQYNHIVWETADDLETRLYDFICAIIGKGKGA
ncbi:MAG: hypothetical protein ACLP2P_04240 [Desulfobaccales bacterium]